MSEPMTNEERMVSYLQDIATGIDHIADAMEQLAPLLIVLALPDPATRQQFVKETASKRAPIQLDANPTELIAALRGLRYAPAGPQPSSEADPEAAS